MYIYNEINRLISNDLKNYDKRALTQETVTKERLECINAYTKMWAKDETRNNLAKTISLQLDKKLYDHISNVTECFTDLYVPSSFVDLLEELRRLDEALTYQEVENLGFSQSAHNLRKQWRKKLRKAHKLLDTYHRNRVNWVKEHNRPHPTYELGATGECHNGLYWTLRAMLLHPSYIKGGFRRVSK